MENIKLIQFSLEFFNLPYFPTELEVKKKKNTIIILIRQKIILINVYIFMNVKSKFLFS